MFVCLSLLFFFFFLFACQVFHADEWVAFVHNLSVGMTSLRLACTVSEASDGSGHTLEAVAVASPEEGALALLQSLDPQGAAAMRAATRAADVAGAGNVRDATEDPPETEASGKADTKAATPMDAASQQVDDATRTEASAAVANAAPEMAAHDGGGDVAPMDAVPTTMSVAAVAAATT